MTGRFLFGFLVGAAVGLLLAPEKGESTRKLVGEAIEEYADKGKNLYNEKKKEFKKKK
ncbi:MAG: YtxH domain-containing protein [Bacteroidota bacterium]|nr:YtxH domain-containing protein [Bacteroidota bacterium]